MNQKKLNGLAKLLDLPAEIASSATKVEIEQWMHLWRDFLQREFAVSTPPNASIDQIKTALGEAALTPSAGAANASDAAGLVTPTAVLHVDATPSLIVTSVEPGRSSFPRTTFALLAVVLPWWLSRPNVWETVVRHAHRWLPAAVIGLGFVWMIWLTPSWFGVFIITLCTAGAIRAIVTPSERTRDTRLFTNDDC
jgi:hypothetical protein